MAIRSQLFPAVESSRWVRAGRENVIAFDVATGKELVGHAAWRGIQQRSW